MLRPACAFPTLAGIVISPWAAAPRPSSGVQPISGHLIDRATALGSRADERQIQARLRRAPGDVPCSGPDQGRLPPCLRRGAAPVTGAKSVPDGEIVVQASLKAGGMMAATVPCRAIRPTAYPSIQADDRSLHKTLPPCPSESATTAGQRPRRFMLDWPENSIEWAARRSTPDPFSPPRRCAGRAGHLLSCALRRTCLPGAIHHLWPRGGGDCPIACAR
jgi:hypothetical protein